MSEGNVKNHLQGLHPSRFHRRLYGGPNCSAHKYGPQTAYLKPSSVHNYLLGSSFFSVDCDTGFCSCPEDGFLALLGVASSLPFSTCCPVGAVGRFESFLVISGVSKKPLRHKSPRLTRRLLLGNRFVLGVHSLLPPWLSCMSDAGIIPALIDEGADAYFPG